LNSKVAKYLLYYPTVMIKGESVGKYLLEYNNSQWLSEDEIYELQNRKFLQLFRYAIGSIPFYRSIYKGIEAGDIRSLADITKLPKITKDDVKNYNNQMVSREFILTARKTTGGSTGEPITIIKSRESLARERAATWRSYKWAGIDVGDRQVRFWGVPLRTKDRMKYKIIDFISNRIRLSAFSFDSQKMKQYFEQINEYNPKYIYGYVSMIDQFSRYMIENSKTLKTMIIVVITTSEVLLEENRRIIEEAFKSNVYNEYGCGEVGSIAHECEEGNLHVMAENIYLEIENNDDKEKRKMGEIIITELNNYAMPLIRYQIKDFSDEVGNRKCTCNRGLPVIGNIIGREYDMIKNGKGMLFHGEFFMYIIEDLKRKKDKSIRQFQVIQEKKSCLCIKIVSGEDYHRDDEVYIARRIKDGLGPEFEIRFERVDNIPREASGKIRLIKSLCAD